MRISDWSSDVCSSDLAVAEAAVWSYPQPTERFRDLVGHYAFYAQQMDRCTVDGEVVEPNEGSFYGGWVTSDVVGPFKGAPGPLEIGRASCRERVWQYV